jgi:hypothetical protein
MSAAERPGPNTMIGIRGRILGGALVLAALAATGACQGLSDETAAAPSATPSPSQTGELTAEADLAIHPPPPADVRATPSNSAVELRWAPPPPVAVTHHYSDRVVAYRIYRRGPGEIELRPIGTSTALTYTDRTVPGAGRFEYAVTSVREHDVEGGRSSPAVVQLP